MNSFYSNEEIKNIGFKSYGHNVLISKKASIYGAENISIGNNVRIDDFCILSGNIKFGSYIHIAAATLLYGGDAGIEIGDFSTISSRSAVYALSDDYTGEFMTNPMVDEKYKKVTELKVEIGQNVIVGTNSTILPGVNISDGVAIGACSLVNKNCSEWGIFVGIPAKKVKDRSKKLIQLQRAFLDKN